MEESPPSSSSSSSSLSKPFSLGLEDDDVVQPRRFLSLGGQHLLSYGGDNGNVSCNNWRDNNNNEFIIAQRYDDGLRAMAVSKDGKRLAVGFDSGETKVYVFDDDDDILESYSSNSHDSHNRTGHHPYVAKALDRKAGQKGGGGDDDTDFSLMSQGVDDEAELNSFLGPEFASPIRDLLFLETNAGEDYQLVVASEEGMCIVNATNFDKMTESPHFLEREAKEHHDNGGIRGLALHGNVLASLAMDGRLCLWDVKENKLLVREPLTCISKKDVGEVHEADPYDRSCRPILFSVGGDNKDVMIATPGNLKPTLRRWNSGKKVEEELDSSAFDEAGIGHIETIVAMVVCEENLIVTSGRDKRLVIWKCQNQGAPALERKWKAVQRYELDWPVTDFSLVGIGILYAAISKGQCQTLNVDTFLSGNKAKGSSSSAPKAKARGVLEDDDDDVDFGSSTGPKTTKGVRFVDDEADEDFDEKEAATTNNDKFHQSDDFGASDRNFNQDYAVGDISSTHQQAPSLYGRMQRKVEPQEAFSPSETFPDNDDEVRRFFCWNHIGSATILEGEDDVNTVDIHFTDSAFKKSISFTDGVGLILGSIGEEGGIFASGLQNTDDDDNEAGNDIDDFGWKMSEQTKAAVRRDQKKNRKDKESSEPTGSQVLFYKYESLENKRFPIWSINLPDGEEVVGASCGIGWSAIMTSRRFVRLFSSGGAQAEIVWLKGEPVTMVGRDRFMVVFYHESQPLDDGTQQLGYTLWDAAAFRVVARGSVSCLSKGAKLTWVGFSNELSLFAMDSDGMVSMLVAAGDYAGTGIPLWEWAPVLDTVGLRKSKDDSHWPIAVVNGKLVSIPLKGGKKYPDASRRPVSTTLGFRMPISRSGFKNQ